jgi:hypothetical protein
MGDTLMAVPIIKIAIESDEASVIDALKHHGLQGHSNLPRSEDSLYTLTRMPAV